MPDNTATPRQMLTTAQAAQLLGVKRQTLDLWRHVGRQPQPPYVRVGGRLIRYRLRDVEHYLDRQTVGAIDPESGPE